MTPDSEPRLAFGHPRAQASQTRSDALEDVLHDITNSVAAARSFAEVVRNRARAGTLHQPEPVFDELVDELDRLGRLAQAARRGARPEMPPATGPVVRPVMTRVDVHAVLDHVLRVDVAPLVAARGAHILRDDPLPHARGTVTLVAAALKVLLTSAIERNPAPFPEVEISGRVLDGGVREFWIRDHVPPRSTDATAAVRSAASVATAPAGADPAGAAAAIATARRAVESLGGEVFVEATPLGDGHLVRFTLSAPEGE